MKEKIYTIPVTDAFRVDCECPMCLLEKKLEDEYIDYYLSPSLMEPDVRIETNRLGFCRRHYELMYNSQLNRLGLGLITDTHLAEKNAELRKIYESKAEMVKREAGASFIESISDRLSGKKTETDRLVDELVAALTQIESQCTICLKLSRTLERYIDVIFYLWLEEKEFRELFARKKGFCLSHFKQLLQGSKKHLNKKQMSIFVDFLTRMQLENLKRIHEEVNWFTKKFDYRNNDAPWGNSRDALIRSIQKIVKYCSLK